MNRNIRAVGKAYKQIISDWREVLPTQSVCLNVPIVMPQDNKSSTVENDKTDKVENDEHDTSTVLNTAKK